MDSSLESVLVSLIGHKFRHNLVSITDLANALLSETKADGSDSLRNDLQTIKQDARSTLNMIDSILDLTVADPYVADPALRSVDSLVEGAIAIARDRLLELGGTFSTDTVSLTGTVLVDQVAFNKAVQNAVSALCTKAAVKELFGNVEIIDNAVQFQIQTQKETQVWIDTPVHQWIRSADEAVTLLSLFKAVRMAQMANTEIRLLVKAHNVTQLAIVLVVQLPSNTDTLA